jgi:serralysin
MPILETIATLSTNSGVELGHLGEFKIHETGCACGECADGKGGNAADYAGTFAPDVVPGDTSSTVTLTLGTATNGAIDTLGDRDWYRVSLDAGQTYTFTIDPTGGALDVRDTYLRLRDSAGTQIAFNDDGGLGTYSSLTFTATSTGTFFIDVGAFSDAETGTFRVLAVNAGTSGTDTIAGFSGTTGTITVGGQVNSSINTAGDHDWHAITLTAGQRYAFRTVSTDGGADVDSVLFIRDANGNKLANNDDGGGGTYSYLIFTPATTGTYYVDVGGYGNIDTGAYRLTAALAPPLQMFTYDQIADQLMNGYWGGPSGARDFNVAPGGTITFNVQALTADGQFLAREALNLWSDALGITFSEVTSGGQITFDDNQSGAFATSSRTGNTINSSAVNVSTAWLTSNGTGLNSYSFQTYIHEIGHALGLGHAGNYNAQANYANDALYLNDAWVTTVMSYFDPLANTYFSGQGFTRQFTVSPMVGDIVATTAMYGTATTTRTGDTTYGFNNTSGRAIYDATQFTSVTYTVVDHGGIDTLDYSGFSQTQQINLNAEQFSSVGGRVGNVAIARGSIIENAIGGSGADTIFGNSSANDLRGGNGADILFGNDGDDILLGEAGDDTMDGGNGADFMDGGNGADILFGNDGDDILLGEAGDDFLDGGIGNDLLLGEAGDDFMAGGNGADILFGNDGNDLLLGEAGDDIMAGGIGNDTMIGGTGGDQYIGGVGNDIYVVGALTTGEAVLNTLFEAAGEGIDEVQVTASVFALDWFGSSELERLTLTDNGNHAAAIGNNFDNVITGGTGIDELFGRGGNDTLIGGSGSANAMFGQTGDDIYVVTAVGDSVIEFSGEGTDTVQAGVASFTLGANVENLTFIGGATARLGVGNSQDNVIRGLGGDDFINGLDGDDTIVGGSGADLLQGGAGGDQFRYEGGETGMDRILDFVSGSDKIALSGAFFTPTGTVAFATGTEATSASSTVLYDPTTGIVYYDDDGNGAGAAVALAQLNAGQTFTAGDFLFY